MTGSNNSPEHVRESLRAAADDTVDPYEVMQELRAQNTSETR